MVGRERTAYGVPPDRRGLTFVRSGPLGDGPDQDRHPGHRGGAGHGRPGHRVQQGVDVGGVLGPEQEVGLGV